MVIREPSKCVAGSARIPLTVSDVTSRAIRSSQVGSPGRLLENRTVVVLRNRSGPVVRSSSIS